MKKVSVVILNWNGADMLRRFLPSVVEFSKEDDIEVCVADNASTDNSCEVVRKEFESVRLITLDKNYGFAEGYNLALKEVNAEYVVLLNSDVEVTKDWLKPMISYLDSRKDVAACQPKLLSYKNREYFEYAGAAGGFIDRYGYPFCRGRIFSTIEKDKSQYNDICNVMWASGAALFIRLEDYREVGGLDAKFFAHMEEIDLCWRLRSRGKMIVYIPQSVVYHVGGATLKKENPMKTFLNFRNNLLMLYKNLPEKELNSVLRIRALLDWIAIIVYILKFDLKNAMAVRRARKEFYKIRYEFSAKRIDNMIKESVTDIKERTHYSILLKYHLFGNKTFKSL